jgi:hypothetical integral membrane protein (TIGR02206 family)
MIALVSPVAYGAAVGLGVLAGVALCTAARWHPGRWAFVAARVIATVLVAVAVSWTVRLIVNGTWSAETSLPLALCDVAVLVAAAACWWRLPLLVELTWFWGMAGTLQAVATPDLSEAFPHLVFFQYVVGHEGIVLAALFLVVGLRIVPRRGAAPRVLAITVGYTAFVGVVDAATGANYMYLRRPPGNWTVLRLLGPWPWYILGAAGVAVVLVVVLDSPFWISRSRDQGQKSPPMQRLAIRPFLYHLRHARSDRG